MNKHRAMAFATLAVASILVFSPLHSFAQTNLLEFGDEDLLNTGTYTNDAKAGTTLVGLAPGMVTYGTPFRHAYPFSPTTNDYPGTDQIFVGSTQSAAHDGYAQSALRKQGPQVLTLDYSTLIPQGHTVDTFTLGIATDDFQEPRWHQPFIAWLNGVVSTNLTDVLNTFVETGPRARFFTIGLNPSILLDSGVLTLAIDQGGDGGDGWAIDFLTVGITTVPLPRLAILKVDDLHALIHWPTNYVGYSLQYANDFLPSLWLQVANTPLTMGTQFVFAVDFQKSQQMFRLSKPH